MADRAIGSTISRIVATPAQSLAAVTHAFLFVLGFSTVFIIGWSGVARSVGELFFLYRLWLAGISGLAVILFGLVMMGLLPLRWHIQGQSGIIISLLIGAFFAVDWTPCVDQTLQAILGLGFAPETAGQGLFLLTGYTLGLAVPFLGLGLLVDRATGGVCRLRRPRRWVQVGSGLLLVGTGLLLFFNQMPRMAQWALNNHLYLDVGLGNAIEPTYLLAVVAGVFSFLSLCILPLVPAYLGYLGWLTASTETFGSNEELNHG